MVANLPTMTIRLHRKRLVQAFPFGKFDWHLTLTYTRAGLKQKELPATILPPPPAGVVNERLVLSRLIAFAFSHTLGH